ncbi:MAG: hypothetical protein A2219_06275 [Elusimicrobia bacterium RIFOXYA2_FULL_50_26]|nr:MAG: hypothetical protein A2219_06275 [Elusimicrobia bacterium RIFOXYA2_FULL_50_26]
MHPFERVLSISKEDIELELRGVSFISWADFLLNPRRLRGSDFLMRWSQGVWSKKRLIEAVNETDELMVRKTVKFLKRFIGCCAVKVWL